MAERDELTLADMANDPNILRLTVRPEGVAAPPVTDTGWGGFGAGGRPEGRLFEPDLTPAPRPTIGERIGIQPIEGWGWSPVVEGAQTLGRGIGGLVQGAGTALSGMSRPLSEPTGGSRLSAGPSSAISGLPPRYQSTTPDQPAPFERGARFVGHEIAQIPQQIRQGYEHSATSLEGPPELREPARRGAVERATDVNLNLLGTGVTAASIRGGASAGVFGGRLAKGFDPNREKLAATMEANGVSPQKIWHETGMVKFADGKWAHEIPDIGASYKGDVDSIASRIFDQKYPDRAGTYGQGVFRGNMARSDAAKIEALGKIQGQGQLYLPDVIDHPELFRAYPELRKMPVSQDAFMHAQGVYYPESIAGKNIQQRSIKYREETQPGKMARGRTLDTLLHEIQHAIQQIEGMAKGSSTHQMLSILPGTGANKIFLEEMKKFAKPLSEQEYLSKYPATTKKEYADYMDDYRKRLSAHEDFTQQYAAEQAYPRTAGENVAELPGQRKDMTPEQLQGVYPPSQMRVPMDQQFVEYNQLVNPAGTTPQAQMGGILKPTPQGFEGPQMSVRPKPDPLYTPSGLATDRQTAGYSNIKGGTPVSGMNWRMQLGQPLETRPAMPIDKALRPGDEVIPIVGDDTRKLQQGYVTEIGGQPVSPVLQQGGFDFGLGQPVDPRTGLRDIWGNAQGAATQIDNMARAAEARGNRPVIVSTTMGKTGADFSHQLYQPTLELLKRNPPDEKLAEILDTFMRTKNSAGPAFTPEQFPGFASPEVWSVLDKAGGNLRSKVMKALDRKTVVDAGGPDIGLIRVSQANPDLYNTPAGHMGYHIANVAPGQTGPAAHTVYPIATRGSDVRGLGGSVPGELMLPGLAKGLEEMYRRTGSKEYLNRMDYYAIRPPNEAAIELGMKPLPKTQVVTKQMIDAIGEYVHKHGLKSLPPAVATLYLANSGGEAKAAPMGSVVDPSRYNVQ